MDPVTSVEPSGPVSPHDHTEAASMPRPAQPGTEDLDFRSYFQRLGSVALLTADEEKTLGWNIQNDGCASSRDRLVCANLRLVVSIARRFMGRGLGMPDLIAEGNLGLLRAVDRFDPAHGARFSTYASWWIKHAIRNGIRQTREIVHIPAKFRDLSARWQREATRQQTASGIPMTPQEIAAAMSVSQATECKVRRSLAQHFSGCTPSLPVAAEHALPDTRELAPDGRLMQREELARVHALLDAATPREASAIRMRFGMDGYRPHSLKQIAEVLGMSRESVRKLLASALQAMGTSMAA